MKKFILGLALMASVSLPALAETGYFTYTKLDGSDIIGAARRVSPNGRFVCGADDMQQTGSFVIDTTNPKAVATTSDGELYDIDNNGCAVGSYYVVDNAARYLQAATYASGRWTLLPLPEAIIGQSIATAISADSRTIAGMAMCENDQPNEPGRYFPIVWKLDEATGKYAIDRLYNDLYLPGTSGFQVMDMTPDGRYICGLHMLNMGDYIGCILDTATGELIESNEIDFRDIKFTYIHPVTGESMLYESTEMFVDGLMDGFSDEVQFGGKFLYANNKYIFGSRDFVSNVVNDSYNATIAGTITTRATIYDIENRCYIDGSSNYEYLSGVDTDLQFTTTGRYVYGGLTGNISDDFAGGKPVGGIYAMDDEARVLVGSCLYYSDMMGGYLESPVVIILEEGLVGVETVTAESAGSNVSVSGCTITVDGAQQVLVFDMQGRLVSTDAVTEVAPGAYLVAADGKMVKVLAR